jgi:DNA-binding transcriptional MerR regulator
MISKDLRTLTVSEVMEVFHVSKVTLWRWQKRGLLVPQKVGKQNLYLVSQIKRVLNVD